MNLQWITPDLPQTSAMRWLTSCAIPAPGHTLGLVPIPENHPFVRDGLLLPSALIEVMAQCAAAGQALQARGAGRRVDQGVLAAIASFEVLAPVSAPCQVHIDAHQEKSFGSLTSARLEARVNGTLVARARMTFHVRTTPPPV